MLPLVNNASLFKLVPMNIYVIELEKLKTILAIDALSSGCSQSFGSHGITSTFAELNIYLIGHACCTQ